MPPLKKLLTIGPVLPFIALTLLVYLRATGAFDQSALLIFQKNTPRVLDLPFSILSIVGTFEIVTLILLLILTVSNQINKIIVLIGYGIVLVSGLVGKSFIPQISPPLDFLRTKIFFSFPTGQISEHFYAYPSGHSARTAFVSAILLFAVWANKGLDKNLKLVCTLIIIVFDFAMFYSRIYLAEHWATDVIGGALLGFAIALLSTAFIFRKNVLK